jgi:predicted permease
VFLERLETELAALPSVTGVTGGAIPILAGDNWGNDVSVEGVTWEPDKDMNAHVSEVAPNYFHVIGATMLQGREFTTADAAGSPKVAIVNEAFAKKFNLLPNVVGKHMSRGSNSSKLDIEIVGLVRDMKYATVKNDIPPVYFMPHHQQGHVGTMYFYVRTASDPSAMLRSMRQLVQRLDPMLPVENLRTMPEEIRINTFEDRMVTTLAASFALLATLLASIGLYGVLAYSIAQRTREIGVRMALGANATDVRVLVLRQVGLMTLVGGALGVGGALALARGAQAMLYKMSGTDPIVMTLSVVFLALVALAAGYVPALRASRVSPMQALRYE